MYFYQSFIKIKYLSETAKLIINYYSKSKTGLETSYSKNTIKIIKMQSKNIELLTRNLDRDGYLVVGKIVDCFQL